MRTKYQIFILFLSLGFLGCSSEQPIKKYKIGFSQCSDDAWRDVMNAEMYRELSFHPELDFHMRVSGNDSEKQVSQIKELVALGIDILIVAPNESKPLRPIIDEVYRAGTPIILIDRKTGSDSYTAYIGANNYEIGETAARYIASQFSGEGKAIEIQMQMTISPAIERHRGFRDGLANFPHIEVVDKIEIPIDMADLEAALPTMLNLHPEVNIIFGQTDLLAETAYKIAQQEGREKDIFFVGIDGIPGTGRGIQAVEDGVLNASMLYPTGGSEAIQLALAILNNLSYEKQNTLETIVINKDNARILHNQMKKVSSLQKEIDGQQQKAQELNINYKKQRTLVFILGAGIFLVLLLGGFLWRSLYSKQLAYKKLEAKNREVEAKNIEVNQQKQEILSMSEELREVTQAKVNFFTNISHEFRTPLTLILAFTEDLMESYSKFGKEIKSNVRPIQENAQRLLRLVNQLMDFRKMESSRMRLMASENDLIAFVQNIMISYYKIAERRNIDFKLNCRHEELFVWFDANMIDKVLFNILSNAFKFTPDNGTISVSVIVDSFEKLAKIVIEDNGKGMNEEDVVHVFKPFYQAENGNKGGTGIGLTLSKALMKLHRGDILLKSVKGHGSRFTILLPLGQSHFSANELSATNSDYFSQKDYFINKEKPDGPLETSLVPFSQKGQTILVIEDNEELLGLLEKKLSESYHILSATNGKDGLELAYEHIPDLIISDIIMPEQSGLEITQTLKSDLRTSHIPIVLLTARSTIEQQIEGTQSGADAYVIKPFNFILLKENVKNLLHNRQKLKEIYSHEIIDFAHDNNLTQIDRDFLNRFVKYVNTNFEKQDLQMTDICEELGLSRSQLYRKVKALLGESVGSYIENIRLRKAIDLLSEGKLTVAEIAYQIGYSSPDYFSTVFKSKYNITPSQFRKSTAAENDKN